jgi:hypothetical protein
VRGLTLSGKCALRSAYDPTSTAARRAATQENHGSSSCLATPSRTGAVFDDLKNATNQAEADAKKLAATAQKQVAEVNKKSDDDKPAESKPASS